MGIFAGVNVRETPGTSSRVIFTTSDYTFAQMLGSQPDGDGDLWYKVVTDGGTEGYVYCTLVDFDVIEVPLFNADSRVMVSDTVNVRARPEIESKPIATLWPCSIEYTEKVYNTGGELWYKIITPGGLEGYIRGDCAEEYVYTSDPAFEETLKAFPKSYRAGLRYLHSIHPNWQFYADNLSVTFEEAVNFETGKKLIADVYTSLPEDWRTDYSETTVEPGYRPASKKALAYFMSPQYFITEKSVFMFMQQSFDPARQNADGLRNIIRGSFLDTDEYVSIIMEAASSSGVSPYVIAGIILQEQGFSGSALCTGTYPGYEGFYNFFNFGASGGTYEEIITSGLGYAVISGWNSKEAAIAGGAAQYADGYISKDQDTYFYSDFNLINKQWNYQYATSIHDQVNKALNISDAYKNTESSAVFRLPVYKNSDTGEEITHEHTFDEGVITEQPAVGKTGTIEYTCTVCGHKKQETLPALIPQFKKGDINGDGAIDTVDGALLRMYFLKIRTFDENQFARADINADGSVDTIDGALMRMHFLKIRVIE